ncbi:MAG: polyprenyl synthetase family protein [Planctomycetes bacterium]|nr:polyprenyl synthetase family protein [Planctomycetota bacterium]
MPTELAAIYAPVEADLARFDRLFAATLRGESPLVQPVLEHLLGYQGKRIRPGLVYLSARAFGRPTEAHDQVALVLELIHNATLVHDDILDEADLRRKLPTVNARWGNETSVLAGDLLFAKAFGVCAKIAAGPVLASLADAAHRTCLGELTQTRRKYDLTVSEEAYLGIIRDKTAALFAAAGLLGSRLSGADPQSAEACRAYGHAVGIAFQIVDDVLDLAGDEATVGKSLGTDLAKGKMTLPLIRLWSILGTAERIPLQSLLLEGHGDQGRAFVTGLLSEHDVLAYARERAREFSAEARTVLSGLPGSEARESLEALAEFVVGRSH